MAAVEIQKRINFNTLSYFNGYGFGTIYLILAMNSGLGFKKPCHFDADSVPLTSNLRANLTKMIN
jgi:hypothetical protein